MAPPLLDIQDLVTAFPGENAPLRAVDGLELSVDRGEILGLVGESGCGKSMTALSVLGLVPPPGWVASGRVMLEDRDLTTLKPAEMRAIRGAAIAMIFQEPMTSLNPVFTVGRQITEGLMAHGVGSRAEAREQAAQALARVGISEAKARLKAYPHQLSGGMRQRVMIAMALAMNPRLIIADEPTTALDVTIQAQILNLMRNLQQDTGASILLITHNLGVVAEMASRVGVMYTGRLVEESPVGELFDQPLHPYTRGLMACLPARAAHRRQKLTTIGGTVPPLDRLPAGCTFSDRCPEAFEACRRAEPALKEVAPGHKVRCFLHHNQERRRRPEIPWAA